MLMLDAVLSGTVCIAEYFLSEADKSLSQVTDAANSSDPIYYREGSKINLYIR